MSEKKETAEKPLDKMTAKELREVASAMPEITGASGMKKAELFEAIKKAKGIKEEKEKKEKKDKKEKKEKKEKGHIASVGELKKMIKALKGQRAEALSSGDRKTAKICRRRISRLKRKTRRAA